MTTATTFRTISCRELNELCQSGETVDVIDVRTPVEFQEVHSVYARNVPLDSLKPDDVMNARGASAEQPLYVICRSGSRSRKACEAFAASGHTNIVNVEGGTQAWDQAGYPVERGRKAISLERQVRIAAGSLVFTGTLLGFFQHEFWLVLPAFVGAGLVFAGITDTCGMGMLIAKMPWNQVKNSCEAAPGSPAGDKGSCCG